MNSLFWKIFFTYWLIILIIEISTAWFTANLSEYEIHPILERQNRQFMDDTRRAISTLEENGLSGLRAWMQERKNLRHIDEIFVINRENKEIYNKQLPEDIYDILNDKEVSRALVADYLPIKNILTYKAFTPDEEEFLIVSTFQHPHLTSYLLAPQRVAFGVIISGIICFLLARYFTSPLAKLRSLTNVDYIEEIDARALDQLGKRTDEFGTLAVDFGKMIHRLHDQLDAKKQLMQDVSHELRSPLARIRVALGLVRQKLQSNSINELGRIEREIDQLESLISELLIFAKISSKTRPVDVTNVNLYALLSYVISDVGYEQQQMRNKNTIQLSCPPGISVNADDRLLHRAIENVVRNACFYSPREKTIEIDCTMKSDRACIVITDSGPGVPDAMLERIFQPFVRVSSARETHTGGSGIGLAIAKQVVDIHGGSINATNKAEGKGLVVSITLPAVKDIDANIAM